MPGKDDTRVLYVCVAVSLLLSSSNEPEVCLVDMHLVYYIIMRKHYLAFALFLSHSEGGHDTKYLFDVKASFPWSCRKNALGRTRGVPSPPHLTTQVQHSVLDLKKPEINNITLLS